MLAISYWSIRAAVAESLYRRNTPESLRKSVALAPGSAPYHALLAEHMEGAGLDPDGEFVTAAMLSPRDSQFGIRLGIRSEVEQDYPKAEKYLLQAAAVDRKFNPRWALMNYYFRRGATKQFWPWAERALEMSYGDTGPLFRLEWEESQDEEVIEKHLPHDRDLRPKLLAFLIAYRHLDRADRLARHVAQSIGPEDLPVLVDYCERVLNTDMQSAVAVWNTLCTRKLLPYVPLDPANGAVVANGDFAVQSIQRGFDWRIPAVDGISLVPVPDSRGIAFRMSGSEPEDCVLLVQTIPLKPGLHYLITYEYQLPESEAMSGLRWEVAESAGRRVSGRSTELTERGGWKVGEMAFASGDSGYADLALHYRRPLGATRAEGSVTIRRVASRLVH